MTKDIETELRPCPFCGQPPVSFPSGDGTGTMIECVTQDCVNPHISYYGDGAAAKVWNRRAPHSPATGGLNMTVLPNTGDRVRVTFEGVIMAFPEGWALVLDEENVPFLSMGLIRNCSSSIEILQPPPKPLEVGEEVLHPVHGQGRVTYARWDQASIEFERYLTTRPISELSRPSGIPIAESKQ